MFGEAREAQSTVEISPLEQKLRDALGSIANLAAQVELAKDLGEIDEDTAERVSRIATHLGITAARISQVTGIENGAHGQNGHSSNKHSNGNSQNGHVPNSHSNGHPEAHATEPAKSNGHSSELSTNGKSHDAYDKPAAAHDDRSESGSDAELFVEIPELIKQHFNPEEYKAFSERDVVVAMHFLENRGGQTSVRELVDVLAPDEVKDTAAYDAVRKGVSTSLKKLRGTELGQRCLRDNGQPTKARRYILLKEAETPEYPGIPAPSNPEDTLSVEDEEALTAKREELFSAFKPCKEENPKGDIPCVVLSDTKLQIGNQKYEYQLTGKREGNKNTTVGMYNGLIELLVNQGKTEIKPSELTELLGLSGTGSVGRAFDNMVKNFDGFPFVRTGTARATRYFRHPDFYFTDTLTNSENVVPTQTKEPNELISEPGAEVPEYPKQLELTEWGLRANVEQNDDGTFTHTIYIGDGPLKLRDITITTLLTLASSRQSMLQGDLLEALVTLVPDMTDEKLRGCLHEIRNCFEYNGLDKHIYQRQLSKNGGSQEILWNLNGIIDGNGVSDFLGLSSVTDR